MGKPQKIVKTQRLNQESTKSESDIDLLRVELLNANIKISALEKRLSVLINILVKNKIIKTTSSQVHTSSRQRALPTPKSSSENVSSRAAKSFGDAAKKASPKIIRPGGKRSASRARPKGDPPGI